MVLSPYRLLGIKMTDHAEVDAVGRIPQCCRRNSSVKAKDSLLAPDLPSKLARGGDGHTRRRRRKILLLNL